MRFIDGTRLASTLLTKMQNGSRNARTVQMVSCLREEFVYSEKRVRDLIFQGMDQVMHEGPSASRAITVSKLTRDAAAWARELANRAGFEFGHWDTACKAVAKAMLGARVMLAADGSPIPLNVGSQAAEVARLQFGYPDITEAYMVGVVIRKLGNVTLRDHTALAHALFRQFDRSVPIWEMEDRVVSLLAMLADRVALDASGVYCVMDSPN